ncbi:type II toxin-antitoxin system HipA family toxin [Halomonas llamarensis]|uniref:Type II toxin-antitoxin system HipA family toxin n=1 Tax=Halomonas llamarensis TaxID=2945104 RepID=A0ABT0SVH6_9GAMM|nr:type II toxin-antitoxin system HipA family toxin [Halomonas llamarensis]MCL7931588.1 type II toxin-antitoxin system HipA family toxin [Halomonas llamarensis]
MSPDTLTVWRNQHRVGTLWRGTDSRLMGFEYDEAWQANGIAISNSLPLSQRTWQPNNQTAHHWFGNLLPEEQARTALIQQLGIPDDDFSLLTAIGGDCAGALTILPPGVGPEPAASSNVGYQRLPAEKLQQWAAFRQRYALYSDDAHHVKPRLSLAGAQDKLPVFWQQETLYLPLGMTPSSHIVKFAVDGREQVILNELYLNTLAAVIGLDCPPTYVRFAGRSPYLLVERYDRQRKDGTLQRLHQEDMCQAMGISRMHKYQQMGGPTLGNCVQTLRDTCNPPARSIQQLLRWQIFNVIVGNSDGHAKNISLLQNDQGKWHIAPAYDLVGTVVLGYDPNLAFSVGEQYNAQQLLPRDWQAMASMCKLSYPFIKREITRMCNAMIEHAESTDFQLALESAGLPAKRWASLQQQRQHIVKQCRKAQRW